MNMGFNQRAWLLIDSWLYRKAYAGVVELVDALDSKSSSERSVGSTPTARTTDQNS